MVRGTLPIHVFLTRPEGRNGAVPARLAALGMQVHELPALELRPMVRPSHVPLPGDFDLVVFVSRYAAQCYVQWLRQGGHANVHWPVSTLAATVGASSANALLETGLIPAESVIHPPADTLEQDSEALLGVLDARGFQPRRVLIIRGTRGRDWLSAVLSERGAQVELLPVYERVPAMWLPETQQTLLDVLRYPDRCIFLLTSSEGVRAVAAGLERLGTLAAWSVAGFVVLHERIGATLQSVLASYPGDGPRHFKVCRPDDDSIVEVIHAAAQLAAKP